MTAHTYETVVTWSGNRGTGTSGPRDYGRESEITADGPAPLTGGADPMFRGDREQWNPEQLLVAALAQCHMLAYLHLCAVSGVVVTAYADRPRGTLVTGGPGGRFTEVVLAPAVTVAEPGMAGDARRLHDDAHRACFIANSVNFSVRHVPTIAVDM
jgi:organic hydroperoxide reductase OsmC/OhrA